MLELWADALAAVIALGHLGLVVAVRSSWLR
jgi:hypothetical protein